MHPAYSVIAFTTTSGAGYGLLFWVSVAHLFGALPDGRWFGFLALALALALATFGLLDARPSWASRTCIQILLAMAELMAVA